MVNPRLNDLDVISILNEKNFYVNYMMVIKGSIIHVKTVVVEKILDETERDVLSIVLDRMRNTFHSKAKEVISAIDIDLADEGMKVTLPKMGDKKNLLDMSTRNAFIFQGRHQATTLADAARKDQRRIHGGVGGVAGFIAAA